MPSKQKELMFQTLAEEMKGNTGMLLTEYHGLTMAEISELRAKLRALNCKYKVVKNTVTKKVLKEIGFEDFSKYFEGPTAVAIQKGDPAGPAKVLVEFAKDHAKLKLKAGILGNKILTAAEVKSLANLPSKNVLIAKFVGGLKSPLYGIVNVLQGPIRNIVYVLEAVKKQKEVNK